MTHSTAGHGEDGENGGGFTTSPDGAVLPAEGHDERSALSLIGRILASAGSQGDSRRFVEAALEQIREWTGCESAAVRLEEAGDYPYFVVQGYPPEFVARDNHLVKYGEDGEPLLDAEGRPVLECICGAIIRGRQHPALPARGTTGSYWIGSTTELLLPESADDALNRVRGHCLAAGYETAAILPLRADGTTYGLLRLNSKRKHAVTASTMAALEPAVEVVAAILRQLMNEETRRLDEAHYRSLFENLSDAFTYCRLLYDGQGAPVDWVYVAVNQAYYTLFGLDDVIGRRASAVYPFLGEVIEETLQACTRVAAIGKPQTRETYIPRLDLWLEVSLSIPAPGHFLTIVRDVTKSRRTEDVLRRSQFSLDNVADYPMWSGEDGRIVEVSESTCRQLQYSREELLRMTVFDLDPNLRPDLYATHWELIREHGVRLVDAHHRKKNGEVFPVEISANHFVFNGAEFDCAFCRDITDRRRLEESLVLTRLSVDQAPDLISWVDEEGHVVYANRAYCDLLGFSEAELNSLYIWDLVKGESPELFRKKWQHRTNGELLRHDAVVRGKDGREHSVEVSTVDVELDERRVGVSFLRNVTERRQAEQALRESEQRYRDLFELESDAHLVVDDETHRILEVNAATTALYGYERAELLGMSDEDLSAEPEQTRLASQEPTISVPLRWHKRKDGTVFAIEKHGRHYIWKGRPVHVVVIRDITERRRTEDVLRRSQFSLDNVADYPMWSGEDGRIVEVSESTCRQLQYSREELLRMTVFDLDPNLRPDLYATHWELIREHGVRLVDAHHRKKNGEVFPVEISANHFVFNGAEFDCAFCRDITDRRRLEESLRLTQFTVDTAVDLIHWMDADGRIVYANQASHDLLGYTVEELQQMHAWDVCPTSSPEIFRRRWAMPRARGVRSEETFRAKDGREFIVEISSTKVEHEGRTLGVSFVRDVSERRRVEQAVRDSEERYRQLFELESDALVLVDDSTQEILEANEAATEMYGYSRSEFLTMKDLDLSAPTEEGQTPPHGLDVDAALRWHRKKDGTVFPVETRERRFEWRKHAVRVAAIRDMTEWKEANDDLEESRQMLRTVLDTVPLSVFWRDKDLRLLGCNAAATLVTGLPGEPVEGLTDYDLPGQDETDSRRRDDLEVMTSGVPKLRYEETVELPRFGRRVLHTSKVPLRDRSGQIIGLLSVHEDVTALTETLRSLRERDEQLRQSQKMEAIGRLAGGIAHDFNNVLTTIIGYSDLILGSPEGGFDNLREDVGEIRGAAERASSLTKQILAFSRRQALEPRVLSLNTVIAATERLLARTIGADVDLKVVCEPELGLVEVDEHQFVQLLLNLAVNARDAMPQGGVLTLETKNVDLTKQFCGTHPDAHAGPHVRLSVSDTGVGMDQDTVVHVFEPFFTTKGPGLGTGLGLATAYAVVKQSGGCIYVTTEPGRGATFDIYLPRFDHVLDEASPSVLATRQVPGRPTILLVDDDVAFRSVTVRMLEKRGYRVLPVGNGEQAVALLESKDTSIDLLLTDVVLPGSLQGIHLAQRAARLHPGMPVIYMSAYSRDTIEKAGRLEEGTDYLEKPFTAENLTQKIRDGLGARD